MAQALTDQDCPTNQILDYITCKCAPICPDDTRPINGQCPGTAAAPICSGGLSSNEKLVIAAAAVGVAILVFGKKGGRRRR